MDIKKIIYSLSIEEKAALLQGWSTWTTKDINHLNIPSVYLSDGPHGLRKQVGTSDHLGKNASLPSTCFPTASSIANSWDESLIEKLAQTLAKEAVANNVHIVLGPGLNIKRSPLCGRNFEYFSEDPFLSGKLAASYIKGLQKIGVVSCPKHFAVNSQESSRMTTNSILDERTLREIYLTGFEIAISEGKPKALMSSYNKVNGEYANENSHLLLEILRNEWKFDGFVVSDWGADNDHTKGIASGSNLTMPAPGANDAIKLVKDVNDGIISEDVIDERLTELLNVIIPTSDFVKHSKKEWDQNKHHLIAEECAEGSIVLLENDGILPINKNVGVAFIGDFAKNPRYQGSGSSKVNPTRLDNLLDCAKKNEMNVVGFAKGFSPYSKKSNKKLLDEAKELATRAETVFLCIGLDEISESEGIDRKSLELPNSQYELVDAVASVNKNIVLVLSGGSPFIMPNKHNYRAAIHGYLNGQAGANAMIKALLGIINPSGKLNETWPNRLEDTPCNTYYPGNEKSCEYRESIFVGYRYYNTANIPVKYPFGYGLSYTSFSYSKLKISKDHVSFSITNIGPCDGAEIAQLYVSCENSSAFRSIRELKGFVKVFLKSGESKNVCIPLNKTTFRIFDNDKNCWIVEKGEYSLSICSDSVNIRLCEKIHINDGINIKNNSNILPSYYAASIANVSDSEFYKLTNYIPQNALKDNTININSPISQLYCSKSILAKLFCKTINKCIHISQKNGNPNLNAIFIYNMPFRAISKMSGGSVNELMVYDIISIVNGHFFSGLAKLVYHFVDNIKKSKQYIKSLCLLEKEEKQ